MSRQWSIPVSGKVVTAGLRLDTENYAAVSAEIRTFLQELELLCQYENDFANPVFRCRRLLAIVERYPPETSTEIYIG